MIYFKNHFAPLQRVRFAELDAELPLTGAWLDCLGAVFALPRLVLGALASLWRSAIAAAGLRLRDGGSSDDGDGPLIDLTTEWAIARVWGAVPALWRYMFQSSALRKWELPSATIARRALSDAVAARTDATRELGECFKTTVIAFHVVNPFSQ